MLNSHAGPTPRHKLMPHDRLRNMIIACCVSLAAIAALTGCNFGAIIGFVAANAEREGSTKVFSEYPGLAGKSFSVIVMADRAMLSEHPGIDDRVLARVNQLIAENAGASAYIQTPTLQQWLYSNPQWRGMTPSEIATGLGGIERLVIIELNEYRLTETGNQFVWDGSATANVYVVEADSGYPDDYAFEQTVAVTFPDNRGFTPAEMAESLVTSALSKRLTDRIAWLFYDHDEPNKLTY